MNAKTPKPKRQAPSKQKGEPLELLPREEALRRADDLLRTLLNSPPDPFTPKKARAKPKRRAK
jgi:hypothetical protein